MLFGGAVFGVFAGIHHWFPKVTGRFLGESLARLQFALMIIRMNMTFMPMHVLGSPRYAAPHCDLCAPARDGRFWNLAYSIGAFLLAASSALDASALRRCGISNAGLRPVSHRPCFTILHLLAHHAHHVRQAAGGAEGEALYDRPSTKMALRTWTLRLQYWKRYSSSRREWPSTKQRSLTTDDTNVELTTVINRRSFQHLLR